MIHHQLSLSLAQGDPGHRLLKARPVIVTVGVGWLKTPEDVAAEVVKQLAPQVERGTVGFPGEFGTNSAGWMRWLAGLGLHGRHSWHSDLSALLMGPDGRFQAEAVRERTQRLVDAIDDELSRLRLPAPSRFETDNEDIAKLDGDRVLKFAQGGEDDWARSWAIMYRGAGNPLPKSREWWGWLYSTGINFLDVAEAWAVWHPVRSAWPACVCGRYESFACRRWPHQHGVVWDVGPSNRDEARPIVYPAPFRELGDVGSERLGWLRLHRARASAIAAVNTAPIGLWVQVPVNGRSPVRRDGVHHAQLKDLIRAIEFYRPQAVYWWDFSKPEQQPAALDAVAEAIEELDAVHSGVN